MYSEIVISKISFSSSIRVSKSQNRQQTSTARIVYQWYNVFSKLCEQYWLAMKNLQQPNWYQYVHAGIVIIGHKGKGMEKGKSINITVIQLWHRVTTPLCIFQFWQTSKTATRHFLMKYTGWFLLKLVACQLLTRAQQTVFIFTTTCQLGT